MARTLDKIVTEEILKTANKRYGLEVTDDNREKYTQFLKRRERKYLKEHEGYDLDVTIQSNKGVKSPFLYRKLLADELMLFSYFIGESAIISGQIGKTRRKKVQSISDLYLFRNNEIGLGNGPHATENRTDITIISLYRSFTNNSHKFPGIYPTRSKAFDEIGKDPGVVKCLGQEISNDIVNRTPSPNPNSYSHGGARR
jgi:hypothetical protein